MSDSCTCKGQASKRPIAPALAERLLPLASAAILAFAAGPLQAQQIIAPTAMVGGMSQSDLMMDYGNWTMSHSVATSPLFDTTGANAAAGDRGSYFYLTGSTDATPVTRQVTVRTDQTLMINLISIVYWEDPAIRDEAGIRADLVDLWGTVSNLSVAVNGAAPAMPAGYTSLNQFLHSSPYFPLYLPAGNWYPWPVSPSPAVVESYMVGLQGLSQGQHQLHFTSRLDSTGPFTGNSAAQDITYNSTAVPEASTLATLGLGLLLIGAIRRRRGATA